MNSLKRKIAIGAAVSALTLAGLGFATTNAVADTDAQGKGITIDAAGGNTVFNAQTHTLWIKDTRKDGMSVRAVAVWDKGDQVVRASGKGDTSFENLDIAKGTKIKVKLCYVKGGKDVQCSKVRTGEA